jgi:hypothetical protein
MPETLLSPSNVLLFGRPITDLSIIAPNFPPPPANAPNPSHAPFPLARAGGNRDVESQMASAMKVLIMTFRGRFCFWFMDPACPLLKVGRGDPEM